MFDAFKTLTVRSAAAAAFLVVITAAPALAQTAAPPATATVPDVGQPEPPASQLAAAHDLVVASGMARSFNPMVGQLSEQIVPMLTRTRPELKQNLTVVIQELGPEFEKKGQGMTDIAARIYARAMTEQELKDAAAFFNSPVGKKYVIVQPGMLDQLVVAMQSWTQELSTFMMSRVHEEMKKKGQDF